MTPQRTPTLYLALMSCPGKLSHSGFSLEKDGAELWAWGVGRRGAELKVWVVKAILMEKISFTASRAVVPSRCDKLPGRQVEIGETLKRRLRFYGMFSTFKSSIWLIKQF